MDGTRGATDREASQLASKLAPKATLNANNTQPEVKPGPPGLEPRRGNLNTHRDGRAIALAQNKGQERGRAIGPPLSLQEATAMPLTRFTVDGQQPLAK